METHQTKALTAVLAYNSSDVVERIARDQQLPLYGAASVLRNTVPFTLSFPTAIISFTTAAVTDDPQNVVTSLISDATRPLRMSVQREFARPAVIRTVPATAALVVCLVVSFAATALAQYRVGGGISAYNDGGSGNSIPLGSYDRQGPVQQGDGVMFDQNGDTPNQIPALHSQANSLGDITGLHAHSFAQVNKPFQTNAATDPFPHRYGIFASSDAIGDYSVTVNNPMFAPGTSVLTDFHVHLHGETIQGAGNTPDTINLSRADTLAQVSFSSIPGGGSFTRQVDNGTVETQFGSGALINFANDADIVTGQFTVMNGVPFTIELQLTTSAIAIGDYRESFGAEANTDFGGTLTFATDRPVFDLPTGYTANSVDGGIVNNAFVVPEPGSTALFATGGLALAVVRFRQGIGKMRRQPQRP